MNFYSHGKLLISGEYLVLKGATALAVPVNYGQTMEITDCTDSDLMSWESYEKDYCWFKAQIDTQSFQLISSSNDDVAIRLLDLLRAADKLNPGFLKKQRSKKVIIKSDFNISWGLGSSSSLLSNIAGWAEVDPFRLHLLVSKGSGYDVVCAREDGPVFFTLTNDYYSIEKTDFLPLFTDKVYFIYLGRKQDSAISVDAFSRATISFTKEIEYISTLSRRFVNAGSISEFETCMSEHEEIVSAILHCKRIKEERFHDLKGEVKSLGAWGGDFAMLTWHDTTVELKKYLLTKNIDTVFTFNEMIKSR